MPKPLMSPGVADPATTTGRDLRAIIQSPMKKEIVMKDHPRSMHLDLLARARAALASHAEGDADIAEIIADLDTAILSIDRAPVAWSIPVYLATIGHGHGTTNVVAVSYRGLQVQVATFCRSQWGEINDSRDPGSLDDAVHELLGSLARLPGLLLYLLTVFVGAGEKHHVVAAHSLVPRYRIRGHGAVGVTDVQLVGRVVDRRRDVEFTLLHVSRSFQKNVSLRRLAGCGLT